MRLKNSTAIPDAVVRDIIRAVKPHAIGGFDFTLRNARGKSWGGHAYPAGSHYHDRRCPFVSLLLGGPEHFPQAPSGPPVFGGGVRTFFKYDGGYPVKAADGHAAIFSEDVRPYSKGYLPRPWLADQVEALVYLAAHELRHLWQARVPRGHRVWGSRGQYSERDADAYAIRQLRAWRRAH